MTSLPLRVTTRAAAYILLFAISIVSVVSRKTIFIIASPFGNLGNRLFLYANVIGFAIEHKAIVVNPAFHPWRGIFKGTRAGALACFPQPPLPHFNLVGIESLVQQLALVGESISKSRLSLSQWASIRINDSKEMANEMVDLDNPLFAAWAKRKHVVILSGYLFITEALMTAHSQKLRLYFSQLKGNQAQDLEPILQLRQECELVIGVVIRHGGYDKWLEGKYYFSTADYIAWIRAAATLYPQRRTGFFLCSDSRQDLSGLEGIAYRFRAGHDLENRAALARCDMLISPPSSYSGWAAYMANIPLLILASQNQPITIEDFKPIHNHVDLRDSSFPPNIDRTMHHIQF